MGLKYVGMEGHYTLLKESEYCPIYTEKNWPSEWYKWLSYIPDKELENFENILMKPTNSLTDEEKEKYKKFMVRKRIAYLINQHETQRLFSYDEQQEVYNFTKENNLNEIIEEKLSYFEPEERQKIKEKVINNRKDG